MKITLKNYEQYFLDYLDGNLNSEQLSELGLFLNLHPELKNQIKTEQIVLKPENITYPNKNFTKKFEFNSSINKHNFDHYCIAYCEQILNDEESKELETFCSKDNSYQVNLEVFKKVYLSVDSTISYPKKELLYKRDVSRKIFSRVWLGVASAAATVVLFFAINYEYTPKMNKAQSVTLNETKIKSVQKIKINNQITSSKILTLKSIKANKFKEYIQQKKDTTNYILAEKILQTKVPNLEFKLLSPRNIPELKKVIEQRTPESDALSTNLFKTIESKIAEVTESTTHHKKLSIIKIAQLGIKSINSLTDSNMSLTENIDSTRNITALSFKSDLVEFHTSKSN